MKVITATIRNYCISGSLALACVFPVGAEAKTLYVNSLSGNDATTYAANNESSPWRTIGRAAWGNTTRSSPNAAEAARAGDTVLIAQGTYSTVGTGNRYEPAYNPVNNGTAGSPITFQANGTVTLTLSSSRGPVIGTYQRNYITWRGFTINQASAAAVGDTGPVVLFYSTGSNIENCNIDGNGDPLWNDNHTGVRIEQSQQIGIRNNRIQNVLTSGVNAVNGAGIQIYESKGLTIEYNEIVNVGSGVFFKAIGFTDGVLDPTKYSDMQDVVRFNLIYNAIYGIVQHRHRHTTSTVYLLAYQNIIRNCTSGITLWGFPGDGPTNGRFVNNTVNMCTYGIVLKASEILSQANTLFYNNLITNSNTNGIINDASQYSVDLGRITWDRNWYWNNRSFFQNVADRYSFSSFQGTYPGQEVAGRDAIDPRYFDQSANNFHLLDGSLALTAGRVVHGIGGANGNTIPVGAYITGTEIIGVIPSGATPPSGTTSSELTPPAPPTNVQIF